MKRVAAVLVVLGFVSAYSPVANAGIATGTVEFEPAFFDITAPAPNEILVTLVGPPFQDGRAQYDTVDMVIGSNDAPITGFLYGDDFIAAFSTRIDPIVGVGFFPFDVFLGANDPTPRGPIVEMGTLMVDLSGLGLTEADVGRVFEVFVNADQDGLSNLGTVRDLGDLSPLFGTGTITVVPEPATLALLSVAAVGGLVHRRRRQSR